ncbi:MAG: hypothetical protein GY913_33990 [Proteobacteria bacterium]|nr:hypothetical protein [Pseudomonadota bacterium]MCP4921940.1 hypothetical protein [Pseudomonadota bacterium]
MLLTMLGTAFAQDLPEAEGPLAAASTAGSFQTEGRYYFSDQTHPDFPDETRLYDYIEVVGRVNLLADGGAWQVGLQADGVGLPQSWYYLDDEKVYEFSLHGEGVDFPVQQSYANLEKSWVTARANWGEVQIGDAYTSFGRGLALNLVKNTDIDVDTSIKGAKAYASFGDWDLQLVTGLVNQQQVQQYNPNRQIRGNKNHMVTGLRFDRYALGPANVGAHAVVLEMAEDVDANSPWGRYGEAADGIDMAVAGATAEFYAGGVDWFVEGDWYEYNDPALLAGREDEPSYGVYGSASFYPGNLAILVEGKRYKNTELVNAITTGEGYELMVGPSLEYERVITEDSSAAVNSNDVYGGRVRTSLSLKKGKVIPFVAVGAYRDLELGGLHFNRAPETIVHPVMGIDFQGAHQQLILNTGYRYDLRDDGFGADRLAHIDATWAFPLVGPFHGELIVDAYKFQWGDNENQQHDFVTSSLSAAVLTEGGWVFVVYQDYTDDPLVNSSGNITDSVYLAGEAQYQPTDRVTVKGFYGAYKAGIRCAGGQCRRLPGFEGARLSCAVTF